MTQQLEATSIASSSAITLGSVDASSQNANLSEEARPKYSIVELPVASEAIVASIGSLGDHTYRLVEPFDVDLTRDGESFVVTWSGTDQFGYGPTVNDAIRDLQLTLIELYEVLTASPDAELSNELQALRAELERRVVTVSK